MYIDLSPVEIRKSSAQVMNVCDFSTHTVCVSYIPLPNWTNKRGIIKPCVIFLGETTCCSWTIFPSARTCSGFQNTFILPQVDHHIKPLPNLSLFFFKHTFRQKPHFFSILLLQTLSSYTSNPWHRHHFTRRPPLPQTQHQLKWKAVTPVLLLQALHLRQQTMTLPTAHLLLHVRPTCVSASFAKYTAF